MTDEQMKHAFQVLRPICVTLTKEHSTENVKTLQTCVDGIPPLCLQNLQEYIVFPLRFILKQGKIKNEEFYCDVLKCLRSVLSKTEVLSGEMFLDVFTSLCLFISIPGNPVRDVSEELKISLVEALSSLLKSVSVKIIEEVYQPVFLPVLGHAVSVLLHLVEKEMNRDLRILSADCLLDLGLMQMDRQVNAGITRQISRLFASFLPGISLTLSRVITGDTKQGYKVTVKALEAWQRFVSLVMGDKFFETSVKESEKRLKTSEQSRHLAVEKTEAWVETTADKIAVLVEKIKSVANHANWRVRLAMVDWAQEMLNNCSRSLGKSFSDFLEVLVSLVGDDYQNVAKRSEAVLLEFKAKQGEQTKSLVELLEENLHSLTLRLPRLIRTASEEEKLSTMKLLNGYLQLLGPDIRHLLNSSTHLQKLGQSLVQVLELDCSSIRIIQERTPGDSFSSLESGQLYSSPRKYFKHFTDPQIYKALTRTCHTLGTYGNTELLFDHFLDMFHQSSVHRKQAILILSHVCQGIAESSLNENTKKKTDFLEPLVRSLLDVYLDPDHFDLATHPELDESILQSGLQQTLSVYTEHRDTSTLLHINSNIVQTCLLLEAVAVALQVLGKEYEYLLMDVLYPVLEKIGHDNHAISQTAYITLVTITKTCNYSCIEELLEHNSSYLVNSISLRLRHLENHPCTPSVLAVILAHSAQQILPQLEDTIREVLEALDSYYDNVGLLFVRVLYALATAILKWYPPNSGSVKREPSQSIRLQETHFKSTPADVRSYFTEYLETKAAADAHGAEVEDCSPDTEHMEESVNEGINAQDDKTEEEKEVPLPYHVEKTKQILEKCVHLLSAPEVKVRLVTMDTVAQGLHILQPYQNELLPLVHKLWPPYTQRLRDKELVVVNKACKCLHTFAEVSEDFIKQRLIKDVFPHLTGFLQKQAHVSAKAGGLYHQSLACKLQLSFLTDVGDLCRLVQLGENHLADVIKACRPYLSTKQPLSLQQACVGAFKSFSQVEPDTVWLLVKDNYNDELMTPPDATLTQPKILGHRAPNEFTTNVMEVLKCV